MYCMKWVWLILVPPFMVPHVNGDGGVESWEELMDTCRERERHYCHLLGLLSPRAVIPNHCAVAN